MRTLELHWSLGDHVCYLGLPEAYFRFCGERLGLKGDGAFSVLWDRNPYVRPPNEGDVTYRTHLVMKDPSDWTTYRPQREFQRMTGVRLDPAELQPNLYIDRKPVAGRVILCEEAGWQSRRGYPHFDELARMLIDVGYDVFSIRNMDRGPRTITSARELKMSLAETLDFMATASAYVGYDSGLAHVAGALRVPYALLCGAIAPVAIRHQSCILAIDVCEHCCESDCPHQCLASGNFNRAIFRAVRKSAEATHL